MGTSTLVIGGTGFIGGHVVAECLARGHEVTVLNRGVTATRVPDGVRWIVGDRRRPVAAILAELAGREAPADEAGTEAEHVLHP